MFLKPLPTFTCPTLDLQNWFLNGPLFYRDRYGKIYCVPGNGTTDGPSIPKFVRSLINMFGTGIGGGSIVHDAGYRRFLLVWNVELKKFLPANLNEFEINALYQNIMQDYKTDNADIYAIFQSLQKFGNFAFNNDVSNPIPHLLVPLALPEPLEELLVAA